MPEEKTDQSIANWVNEHWYQALVAMGAAIAVASIPVSNHPGLLIGVGLALFGAGEWHCHGRVEWDVPATAFMPAHTRWARFRKARPLGIALDCVGTVLFVAGIAKALAS